MRRADGVFQSAVVGFITDITQHFVCIGEANEHSLFDIASVTKSVVGTTLAMQFLEQKTLHLNDSVTKFLPQASSEYQHITLFHLLTHTSGLDMALSSLQTLDPVAFLDRTLHAPLVAQPGSKYFYQNINTFLLCRILELVASQSLDLLANETIFAPLKMSETTFHPQRFANNRFIPTEILADGTVLRGIVQDESTRALYPHVLSGAAGLFSSAFDLTQYVQMLLRRGEGATRQVLSPESIKRFTHNAIDPDIGITSLGWELASHWMGEWPATTFGKTGFTGCSLSINLEKKFGLIILSNRTYPHRPKNSNAIMEFRRSIHNSYYATT